jgi:hypothetical protein
MELSLIKLLRIGNDPDFSSPTASYYKHLPHMARFGYLHTIFAPLDRQLNARLLDSLDAPECLRRFLAIQNGAALFFNRLSFYGIVERGRLLNRRTERIQSPFNIADLNLQLGFPTKARWLLIGSYRFDGTNIVLSRTDGIVRATARKTDTTVREWSSLGCCLQEEVERLSNLFDNSGNLLVDPQYTVPRPEMIV